MHKRKRELFRLAEKEGLEKVNVVETNGNHYRIEALYKGKSVKVVTSYSPSCHRSSDNLRSYIRRSMRAIDNPVVSVRA